MIKTHVNGIGRQKRKKFWQPASKYKPINKIALKPSLGQSAFEQHINGSPRQNKNYY